MKNLIGILAGSILLTSVYTFLNAQGEKVPKKDYIILHYSTWSDEIALHSGGLTIKSIECKKRNINNCVVDLLSTLRSEGYELVSTTTAPTTAMASIRNGDPEIFVFLRKVK